MYFSRPDPPNEKNGAPLFKAEFYTKGPSEQNLIVTFSGYDYSKISNKKQSICKRIPKKKVINKGNLYSMYFSYYAEEFPDMEIVFNTFDEVVAALQILYIGSKPPIL